jgi:hypothetical protein
MEGDLVLHDGRWVRLEHKRDARNARLTGQRHPALLRRIARGSASAAAGVLAVTVMHNGETSVHRVQAADVTCVKRYAQG